VAVWRQQVFSLFVQEIVEVHATRNLSQSGVCLKVGMDRCCRPYILLVSRRLGLIASLGLPTVFCKHSRYIEVLLAGARGFYLSLLERVLHVKIFCLCAVISYSFFVIAYHFYNIMQSVESSLGITQNLYRPHVGKTLRIMQTQCIM
jgi:hypothetical protein